MSREENKPHGDWGGVWNTHRDLLASAGGSGEPTCDVAAKKSKSVVGRLERGQPASHVRGVAPLCPGQGLAKVTEAWGRLGTGWGMRGSQPPSTPEGLPTPGSRAGEMYNNLQ